MIPFIGTAGWTLPRACAEALQGPGSHLERYAAVFPAVEINSTFYRAHRPATFARWAASVPESFRFSVKLPKSITHELRLADAQAPLEIFIDQVKWLGDRLGCLVVQLPPSLEWRSGTALAFLDRLRSLNEGDIAIEPRHATWFTADVEQALVDRRIARVAADPPRGTKTIAPGGWEGLAYFRLHGSPRVYYSRYDPATLGRIAARLGALVDARTRCWCIFDNTASGVAAPNALELLQLVASR